MTPAVPQCTSTAATPPLPPDARAATKNDTSPLLGQKLGALTVRANSVSHLQGEGVGSPGCFPRPQSDDGGM